MRVSVLRAALGGSIVLASVAVFTSALASPSPTATPLPSPTPGLSPTSPPSDGLPSLSPRQGTAFGFPRRFSYEIPAGAGLVVTESSPDLYQFRHPVGPDAYDAGIAIRAVSGGRLDPCHEGSAGAPVDGPDGWIRYFRSIPTVTVSDLGSTTVGGWPARTAQLVFGPPTAACPDVWLWTEGGSITVGSGRSPARVTMTTVAGQQIAIIAFIDPAVADPFIASIRFTSAVPSPSGGRIEVLHGAP